MSCDEFDLVEVDRCSSVGAELSGAATSEGIDEGVVDGKILGERRMQVPLVVLSNPDGNAG